MKAAAEAGEGEAEAVITSACVQGKIVTDKQRTGAAPSPRRGDAEDLHASTAESVKNPPRKTRKMTRIPDPQRVRKRSRQRKFQRRHI